MTKRALDHGKPPSEPIPEKPIPEEPVADEAPEIADQLPSKPPSRFARLMKIRFQLPNKPERNTADSVYDNSPAYRGCG